MARTAALTPNGRTLRFTLDARIVDVDEYGTATYAFPLYDGDTLLDYVQVAGRDRRSAFDGMADLYDRYR